MTPGPYAVQAAIADLHLQQPRDWGQIAALYGRLAVQTGSPVVELNRAIAVAELDGPEAGLAVLDALELDHYRYFHSARAELLRRAGRDSEARHAYRRALDLAQTDGERRYLRGPARRAKSVRLTHGQRLGAECLAVGRWCRADEAPKVEAQVGGRAKAALSCDFVDAEVGSLDEFAGTLDPHCHQPLER